MRTPPPTQHLATYYAGPLNFLEDEGPLLLLCIGCSLGMTLLYFWLIRPPLQRRNKKQWLLDHRSAMRKYLILQYALGVIHKRLPNCTNCGQDALQFWDHGRELLVYRCENCRFNHTLSPFHYPEVILVLDNLPGLFVILEQLKKQPHDLLGKHLLEQCDAVEWYCRKSLSREQSF